MHTSYLANGEYRGGARKEGTFAEFAKRLIDAQHEWFTEDEPGFYARNIHGIHFYPCLAVIEKRAMEQPIMSPVGRLF
jgi:hypothetical protein